MLIDLFSLLFLKLGALTFHKEKVRWGAKHSPLLSRGAHVLQLHHSWRWIQNETDCITKSNGFRIGMLAELRTRRDSASTV